MQNTQTFVSQLHLNKVGEMWEHEAHEREAQRECEQPPGAGRDREGFPFKASVGNAVLTTP